MTTAHVPVTNILGVGVSAINMNIARECVADWVKRGQSAYICVTTVHCIMEAQKDESLRSIYNGAGLVTPDGMPLVWLSHWAGYPHVGRVYGPDLMLALCADSHERGYKHFLYGGADGVPELLRETLSKRFPELEIVGAYSPPFRALTAEEDDATVKRIKDSGANIVWIGLGAPKQDIWMAQHASRLERSVLIGVGAAFDFHIGRKKQAPRWMQHMGLEWLFRLLTEPKRLWYRYLVYNPLFMLGVLAQKLGLRTYDLPLSNRS